MSDKRTQETRKQMGRDHREVAAFLSVTKRNEWYLVAGGKKSRAQQLWQANNIRADLKICKSSYMNRLYHVDDRNITGLQYWMALFN